MHCCWKITVYLDEKHNSISTSSHSISGQDKISAVLLEDIGLILTGYIESAISSVGL